jgi:hypothetical protein
MAREQLYVPDALFAESWRVLGDEFNRSRLWQWALAVAIDERRHTGPVMVCSWCGYRAAPGEPHSCAISA